LKIEDQGAAMRGFRGRAVVALVALSVAIAHVEVAETQRQQAAGAFDELAALVERKMAEYSIPGVAFGVVKDGRATLRGFGEANVDNPQPVTPDTIFAIASISKTVTTTAIMRLVEQKKLDLNAPVQKYLPEFAVADPDATRGVTIWHLLTHTPGWEGQQSGTDRGAESLPSFVESMKEWPQLAPPGAVWSYNNAGFTLAGRVIEVVSGQPIHQAIRALVLEPIGLTRAFTRLEDLVRYPFAVPHRPQGGQTVTGPLSRSNTVTAGGVSMTLRDLLKYASFHLGNGTNQDGERVLSRASLDLMQTPKVPKKGTDEEMGLGWHLRRVGGVMTAAHGGTLGHLSLLELVPERRLAFAILTNHSNGWRLIQDVERALLRTMEGLSLAPTQAIGHRGVNETRPDVTPMASPPPAAPYVGTYSRPPLRTSYTVTEDGGRVLLDKAPLTFFAVDRAVVASGNQQGNPVEFIRRDDGTVGWIRVIGRIAKRSP
jgi:CubicO group peptidase (beta-lactamase class C family)